MNSSISLKQQLKITTLAIVGASLFTLIGSVLCLKVVIDAKNKHHRAVGTIMNLDEIQGQFQDVTIMLQNTHASPQKEDLRKKMLQGLKEARNSMSEVLVISSGEDFLPSLNDAIRS